MSVFFFKGCLFCSLYSHLKTSLKECAPVEKAAVLFSHMKAPLTCSAESLDKNPTLLSNHCCLYNGGLLDYMQNVKTKHASCTTLNVVASRTGISGFWFHFVFKAENCQVLALPPSEQVLVGVNGSDKTPPSLNSSMGFSFI